MATLQQIYAHLVAMNGDPTSYHSWWITTHIGPCPTA
jgi:hypothetical protein